MYRTQNQIYTFTRDPLLSSIDESKIYRFQNWFYRSNFETSENETSGNETYMNSLLLEKKFQILFRKQSGKVPRNWDLFLVRP